MQGAAANLISQRCFNHATREAVVRCPECGRFFCRECVTEHDDRMICTACLKRIARVPLVKRPVFLRALRISQMTLGFVIAWFFFFAAGRMLLKIPTTFHEGALWQVDWIDKK